MKLIVFIESWITNNSEHDFILKLCSPGFFYSAPRVSKIGGIASFAGVISI